MDTSLNSKGGGTMMFMAPECREGKKSSSASDVFSLGMTAIQILTRAAPGLGQWDEQVVAAVQMMSRSMDANALAAPASGVPTAEVRA